ncbi:hypothetical protein VB773_22155 [Haloarculaceae archaeon H-GB2-1]|nr:hypothetical protein [Haloarculaceae archaeon H-GB11]MEA5410005.1 hypothetical protein [Haloarculaceae archaeon H-GB2-1]
MNVPSQFGRIFSMARSYDPDLVFGRGPYAVFAGQTTRTPVVLVLDSEPSQVAHTVSSKFARSVLSPVAFRGHLGPDHYRFDGLKECAYLHPDVFTPDPSVRESLGVDPDEPFVLTRFNADDALHDVGKGGLTLDQRRRLIHRLAEDATVFVSDEGGTMDFDSLPARPYDVHPARIHDAMAEASMLVADTGTMVTEAGLLGTPAIRIIDETKPSMGEFQELQDAGLIFEFRSFQRAMDEVDRLLSEDGVAERWQEKRHAYLETKANLTELLVEVAERSEEVEQLSRSSPRLQPA